MMRWWALALMMGCSGPGAELVSDSGPQSGYYPVDLTTDLEVQAVHIGGIATYHLEAIDGGYRFMVQGHPDPGAHDVVLTLADGTEEVLEQAYTYEAGMAGFERFVTIGASLGQGVQGGVPTHHGQLHSPSRFIAQQTGAYHPIPLLIDPLFIPMAGSDISAPPLCQPPNVVDHIVNGVVEVVGKLEDEEQNQIGFYMGRVDADIEVYNVATGSSNVSSMVYGPPEDSFDQQLLSKLVFDPYGNIIDPVPTSQLEIIQGLEPTVIISPDTYGNNLIGAIVNTDTLEVGRLTSLERMEDDLDAFVDGLASTGAQVFLATIPRPTLLPATELNIDETLARGATQEEVDALLGIIEDHWRGYRDLLLAAAERHDNVHVVDVSQAVEDVIGTGVPAGSRTLTIDAYGGLLSTDGVHFADGGYAFEANLFIDKMNEVMGTDIEKVDLGPVAEADPYRAEALVEGGLDPACLPNGG